MESHQACLTLISRPLLSGFHDRSIWSHKQDEMASLQLCVKQHVSVEKGGVLLPGADFSSHGVIMGWLHTGSITRPSIHSFSLVQVQKSTFRIDCQSCTHMSVALTLESCIFQSQQLSLRSLLCSIAGHSAACSQNQYKAKAMSHWHAFVQLPAASNAALLSRRFTSSIRMNAEYAAEDPIGDDVFLACNPVHQQANG